MQETWAWEAGGVVLMMVYEMHRQNQYELRSSSRGGFRIASVDIKEFNESL
jgi:hypothetical protein